MAKRDEIQLLRGKNRQLQRQLAAANQTIRNMKNEDVRGLLVTEVARSDAEKARADSLQKTVQATWLALGCKSLLPDRPGSLEGVASDRRRRMVEYHDRLNDVLKEVDELKRDRDNLQGTVDSLNADLLRAEFDRSDLLKIVRRYLEPAS